MAAKKNKEKMTNKMVIKTDGDFIEYDGSTPFVEFDENWNQMPLTRTNVTIPREHLTRMFPLAYLAGKVSAMEQKQNMGLLAIITLLAIFILIGVVFFGNNGTQSQVKTLENKTNDLSGDVTSLKQDIQLLKVIAVKLNVSLNDTMIPTVGG